MFFVLFILVLELNYFSESLEMTQQPSNCDPVNSTPKITVPLNIIKLHNKNLQEYVVARKTLEPNESFVISCTSNQPVDWRFNGILGNTVVKSERSVTNFRLLPNGTSPGLCYHSSLIFNSFENEITGQYICLVDPDLSLNPWNKNGFRNSGVTFKKITLFSGLSLLTLTNDGLTYDFNWLRILRKAQKYNDYLYNYVLPCSRNHPEANISVYYKNDEESPWISAAHFHETRGVSVTIQLTKNDLPRIYKCEATNESHNTTEIVITNILQYPTAVFWPTIRDSGTVYMHTTTFYCISRVPIRIFKTDDLQTELKSTTVGFVNHYINMGFTGTQAVQIDISSYKRKLEKSVSGLRGEIVCQDIETNGTMVDYSWKYEIIADIGKPKQERRGYLNGVSNTAECLTTALNIQDSRIEYIKGNTHAELSLQQNCLYNPNRDWSLCTKSNNSWPVQRYNGITDPIIVSADIPGKLSGAFNCDVPDLYNQNGNFYDVFSPTVYGELGDAGNPRQNYIKLTSFSKYIINLGDTIQVLCESNQMYFHGHAHWVVVWYNNTCSSVPETWIEEETIKTKNAFYSRKSKIMIDNMEVKGISCGAIPIAWNSNKGKKSQGVCGSSMLVHPELSYMFNVEKAKTTLALSDIIVVAACVTVIFILIVAISGFFWARRNLVTRRDVAFKLLLQKFFDGYEADGLDKNDVLGVAESQPYDTSYEIKMENLKIEWDIPLGSGAFGIVLKGIVSNKTSDCKKLTVAVKTVKNNNPTENTDVINGLMCELKVMIYIGQHPNIVCLMGAVTEKLSKREMYILLEYCENGCLYDYLKEHRSSFKNNFLEIPNSFQYSNLYTNIKYPQYCYSSMHLFNWSCQIVSGMEYLAQKKVIHGDLATRNVLLNNALSAKISDFGLARRLYEKYEYVKTSNDPLPWRWLAVESLRNMTFSAESDVWAFGVTLWEIFSLALTPYAGHRYTIEFISVLENGHRLAKPEYMSEELYKVVTRCWEADPKNRPEFSDLSQIFDRMAKQNGAYDKSARANEIMYTVLEE